MTRPGSNGRRVAITAAVVAVVAGIWAVSARREVTRVATPEVSAPPAAPEPAPPPAETQRAQPAPPSAATLDPEVALTERVRDAVEPDPSAAVALVEQGEREFPGGALSDERSFLKMRALVNLGHIGRARDEATEFFRRYPESPWAERVWRLTGVHPTPRVSPVPP